MFNSLQSATEYTPWISVLQGWSWIMVCVQACLGKKIRRSNTRAPDLIVWP